MRRAFLPIAVPYDIMKTGKHAELYCRLLIEGENRKCDITLTGHFSGRRYE